MANNWLPAIEELESTESNSIIERLNTVENEQQFLLGKIGEQDIRRKLIKEKRKKKLKPTTGFTKVNKLINMKAVRNRLFTPAEERMLFKLIPFCNLESNIISDEDGYPMIQKDIINLVGMDKSDVIAIMNGLVQKGIITKNIKGKNTHYKFNSDWIGN